ncbi:MAG: hypothetical protein ACI9OJ_005773, partial [Myxococcota bacterium]
MSRNLGWLSSPVSLVALVTLLGLTATSAQARPLELHELFELERYLECAYSTCADACDAKRKTPLSATYSQFVQCEQCLADNKCSAPPRLWEKDGVAPITARDYELAIVEQQHPDDVCYADADQQIVRPPAACAGTVCLAQVQACLDDPSSGCAPTGAEISCQEESFGPTCWFDQTPRASCPAFICNASVTELAALDAGAQCADADGDGLPAWIEAELGANTGAPCDPDAEGACLPTERCSQNELSTFTCQSRPCDESTPCGFFEICEQAPDAALAICTGRGVCNGAADATLPAGIDHIAVGEICNPAAGACVACVNNGHCSAGERCTASGSCLAASGCQTSLDCTAGNQVCDAASGFCVDCITSAECPDGQQCGPLGTCEPGCSSDLECTALGQLCDIGSGHCVDCVGDAACAFDSVCVRGTCRPRRCSDGSLCNVIANDQAAEESLCAELDCHANVAAETPNCTAFHLEKVAEDDIEVIIHVHYDFTPIPARVLDLFLEYDGTQLDLQDARPLSALQLSGKNLASSHLSDGTLVLNTYDIDGSHPVPTGPIIELVFRRIGSCPTEVRFSRRPELLEFSVAPKQGDTLNQRQLENPLLWGAPIRLCARSEVTPKMRLWYGFETLADPLAYSAIPSADDICAEVSECTLEPDAEIRARVVSRLRAMQRGNELVSDSTPGVNGKAVLLDGAADHLRMPMHYEKPLTAGAQSFSFSTWFYTEGNSDAELPDSPQLLFTHNAYNERTVFGLMSVETGDANSGLAFFVGDVLDPRLTGEKVITGAAELPSGECATVNALDEAPAFWIGQTLPLRTWHHVAFTLNADYDAPPAADDARLTFYLDGVEVGCVVIQQPPDAIQCPQFAAGTDVIVHDEGDVLGGRSPEYLYLAVRRSNLMRVERMDPAGEKASTIIGDSEFNYQDPDYSPILDRLLYASDASGHMEIWIADGDGSNRRKLTTGFGDSGRNITARRPRFAPDGSGIVFDSNVFDVVAGDNTFERVRHIYYMEYDPTANAVAIPLADSSVVDVLEYNARLADQSIDDYRMTSALDRHHKAARWLVGRDASNIGAER